MVNKTVKEVVREMLAAQLGIAQSALKDEYVLDLHTMEIVLRAICVRYEEAWINTVPTMSQTVAEFADKIDAELLRMFNLAHEPVVDPA